MKSILYLLLTFTLVSSLPKVQAQDGKSVLLVIDKEKAIIPNAKVKNLSRNIYTFANEAGVLYYDTLFAHSGDTFEVSSMLHLPNQTKATNDSTSILLELIRSASPQFASSQDLKKRGNASNLCEESLPMVFMPGQKICFRLPVDQFSLYLTEMDLPISLEHDSIMIRISIQDPNERVGIPFVGRTNSGYLVKTGRMTSSIHGVDLLSATATKQHWVILEFLPSPNGRYRAVWSGCHTSAMPQYHPKIKGRLGINAIQDEWYTRTNWYPSFSVGFKHN